VSRTRWLTLVTLGGLVCAGVLFGDVATAQSRTKKPKKSVTTLKKDLRSVESEKKAIQSKIHATRRQRGLVVADMQKVDAQLTELEDDVEKTTASLRVAQREQIQLSSELEVAQGKLQGKKEVMRRRLRAMYMQPPGGVLSTVVKSRSLGDLAARREVFELIAKQDADLVEDVRDLRNEVQRRKLRQDELVEQVDSLRNRQIGQQRSLRTARVRKSDYLVELREQEGDLREEYEELEQESREIEAQIRAYLARTGGSRVPAFRGNLLMPIAGGRVGSGFGMRFHPILKRNRMHTGVDIGARSGTPIRAAGPGVVISASYRGGYGNCVVIDHGGGLSTLYAHCSRVFVRAGQKVDRGQKIAAVGSTGLSTGPHLHFETRINGRPVNPVGRF